MTATVEFYFDLGSPAAYLASTQLPAVCARTQTTLSWKPMLLGGVFQATGNQSLAAIPAKGRYIFKDFARFARRYGVPLATNPHFPINTLTLMRMAAGLRLRGDPAFVPFVEVAFHGIWVESRNLNDPTIVADMLQSAGLDPAALAALAGAQDVKDHLKSLTQEAIDRGVFGAPTCFVGREMFWGQDRLDFVEDALRAAI